MYFFVYASLPVAKVYKFNTKIKYRPQFEEILSLYFYDNYSHEKKKMYWEQLELRCRSFYQQQSGSSSNHGSVRGHPMPPATYCSCCEECRYPSIPTGPQVYPWDNHHAAEP